MQQLDISEGVDTVLRSGNEANSIPRWIELGGRREDEGTFSDLLLGRARFLRHFLDPLQPWDRAGLSLPPFIRFESSVRWAQRTNQDGVTGHGNYSWPDARRYYLTALTGERATDREQAFADTFRALGQVMHLIVDASVPEHVRDDVHPLGPVFGNYEYWVLDAHTRLGADAGLIAAYLSAPITPDPGLFQIPIPTGESVARVPVARLFDSDLYLGANPEVTAGGLIGIAEVANANFLSEDTRHGQYPHPTRANMERYVRFYTKTGLPRAYYRMRPGFGLPVDPVAQECVLNELTGTDELCVDTDVWRETARHMLPRAVGYSAALLNYFFRDKLDFEINLDEVDPDDPTRLRLVIKNGASERMDGEFTIYGEDADGNRTAVTSAQRTIDAGSRSDPVLFTPPRDIEKLILVFKGTLGQEEGAVAGTVKPWVPYIFAIQEAVELLGEERRVENIVGIPPEGRIRRISEAGQQRITGRFALPDAEKPAGKYLKRISVGDVTSYARLYLNGQDVGGAEWDRDTSPIQEPTTWALVVTAPAAWQLIGYTCDPICRAFFSSNLPRTLVLETMSGTKLTTPLVLWRSVASEGYLDYAQIYTRLDGALFFGDGNTEIGNDSSPLPEPLPISAPHTGVHFIPLEAAGRGVGRDDDSAIFTYGACGEEPCWNKNGFEYYLSRQSRGPTEEDAEPPQVPEPPPVLPPPAVRVKRDYFPKEMERFNAFNIRPPDYEIALH